MNPNDRLVINRNGDTLVVKPRADGFDLTVSGGGNVTEDELALIETYVTGKPGADAFLDKVRQRMER